MTEAKQIGTVIPLFTPGEKGSSMALPMPSMKEFTLVELAELPERLDNPTMRALRTFFNSVTPPDPACDPQIFSESLRAMVACLPRQTGTDELGGKLMAAMYKHQLATFSASAIEFLRDTAVRRCKWFPTVADCLEILTEFRRPWNDGDRARSEAQSLFNREDKLRDAEERA